MSINKVMITGNLTRDPEMRASQSGTQILRFGVAVNERRRQQDGSYEERPNFVDCVMFGTRADALSRYLSKGTKVAIEGRLSYSSWEKDGQRRSKLEVIVDDLEFMSSRNGGGNNGGGYQQQGASYPAPQAAAPAPAPQAAVPPAPAPAAPAPAAPAPVASAPAAPAPAAPAPAAPAPAAAAPAPAPASAAQSQDSVVDADIPF